jgi:tRNA nucleotidyltransferase (CCA-adding enzyme)
MTQLLDLPNAQRRALDLVKEVATEKECRPFLVGGPVRDLLLGRGAIDVDLTLEDGGSTLARALAKRINGRVRSFPQFLTYKVTAEGLPEIDIATARKERYRHPGALPAVTAGRLKDDLLRRDFSINAIALDLLSGSMHDPANGERDLGERLIRVLHDRSFIDDPTRIFRAIRLASRLEFAIEENTAKLMADAIAAGALATVSKERTWRELFLAMHEDDAPRVLKELNDRGVLEVLFGRRVTLPDMPTLEAMQHTAESDEEIDREVLYTGALLRGDASPIDLEGSGFSQKRARKIVEIANELPRIREALAAATTDPERFRVYDSMSAEARCVVAAENASEIPHLARYAEFRDFQIPLRGNDLEVPGGPHVARALERTREAVFTGEIPAEDARRFAREMAKRFLEEQS